MTTKSSAGPDPRPYVGRTVRHEGQTYLVINFAEVEDEGVSRIYLDTEDGTALTLAWGQDFSSEFRIVA